MNLMTGNKVRGFTQATIAANQAADWHRIGVGLGRFCITESIPASVVATALGVTKWTVYRWFSGECEPHRSHKKLIRTFIKRRQKRIKD
jgi:DNA-binding transcriptional regulator YiaG